MKTHFPATPLYTPWGKQLLRDSYKFTVKPQFPAPPVDPLWEISDGAVLLALLFLSQGILMNQTSSLEVH